ncbi:hypothetical protein H7U19_03345 [Hyunsoonleella sp. SJ7]|uniref:Lipoprotein n=1 Tax=Hyunsoonleella aquatilis TaxID=2762758 RepID=A0A923H6T9_9FLAO|nr:hypothetical protein [Hyunsoonleella aquatilis]MBC3757426.1 hypothetical protein [Hyunsoonleella aquatilis]
MKNKLNNFYNLTKPLKSLGLLITAVLSLTACETDDVSSDANLNLPNMTNNEVITVPFFVENGNGDMPSSSEDLLYEFRLLNPILNREGNHLTWEDFSTVSGIASVACMEGGFEVEMQLSGLIPNGVYTFWNVTFHDGGMDPSKEMLNIRGIGCIGASDGSENYFIASNDGTGYIKAFTQTPNSLSMIGDIKACPLSDEVEFHIVGAYHLDSKTWGADLGPDGTAVEQFGFIFKN